MTELPHGRKLPGRVTFDMVEPCPKKTGFMRQNFSIRVGKLPFYRGEKSC